MDDILKKLHPCAVLETHQIQHGSFPPQISLEPSACLELFKEMQAVVQKHVDRRGRDATEAAYAASDMQAMDDEFEKLLDEEVAVAANPWPIPAMPGGCLKEVFCRFRHTEFTESCRCDAQLWMPCCGLLLSPIYSRGCFWQPLTPLNSVGALYSNIQSE